MLSSCASFLVVSPMFQPDGRTINVTESNKKDYVRAVAHMKLTDAIREQIEHFQKGFYEIVPQRDISIFDESVLLLMFLMCLS